MGIVRVNKQSGNKFNSKLQYPILSTIQIWYDMKTRIRKIYKKTRHETINYMSQHIEGVYEKYRGKYFLKKIKEIISKYLWEVWICVGNILWTQIFPFLKYMGGVLYVSILILWDWVPQFIQLVSYKESKPTSNVIILIILQYIELHVFKR